MTNEDRESQMFAESLVDHAQRLTGVTPLPGDMEPQRPPAKPTVHTIRELECPDCGALFGYPDQNAQVCVDMCAHVAALAGKPNYLTLPEGGEVHASPATEETLRLQHTAFTLFDDSNYSVDAKRMAELFAQIRGVLPLLRANSYRIRAAELLEAACNVGPAVRDFDVKDNGE